MTTHRFYHMTQCGKLFQHKVPDFNAKDFKLHKTLEESESQDVSEWAKFVNNTIDQIKPKLKGWNSDKVFFICDEIDEFEL